MIHYTTASTEEDLVQIKALQAKNLPDTLSDEERTHQGFVTVEHSLDLLSQMNNICPHVIAKQGSILVGYALCMDVRFGMDIPILRPMFEQLSQLIQRTHSPAQLTESNYLVMGQICIDRPFRGQGVFRGLYAHMRTYIPQKFEYIVTEVDSKNSRSCRAPLCHWFPKNKPVCLPGTAMGTDDASKKLLNKKIPGENLGF